jgi:Uma2 family endonuclease
MSAAKLLLTPEEFDNYPFEEDKRYELDEGELIEMTRPAYRHNRVLRKLIVRLDNFLERTRLGEAMISENLYALAPLTRRAPDVAVILGDRQPELEGAKVISIIPEIVAEVLSPNERPGEIHRKLNQYFQAGVKEVWLIDPEAREIEIWTGPALPAGALSGGAVLESPLLPGFALPLDELFS